VGKSTGKHPLRTLRRRQEDKMKMDLRFTSYESERWMELSHNHAEWWASGFGYLFRAASSRLPQWSTPVSI
jgi:hypothetical protein